MPAPTSLLFDGTVISGILPHVMVSEAPSSGLRIGTFGAVDPDTGEIFSFSLLDDAGGRFFLDGDALRVSEGAVFDAVGDVSYTVRIRVTDSTGLLLERDLIIGLTDDPGHFVRQDATAGNDTQFSIEPGTEYFLASAGNDTIDADFSDVVVYGGRREDYQIDVFVDGDGYGGGTGNTEVTITDLRVGGPDGIDLIINPASLRFADGDFSIDEVQASGHTGLTLDGRLLDVDAYLDENPAIGTVVGQLGLRSRPSNEVPVITTFEVLGFKPGQVFPDDLSGAGNPFSIDGQGRIVIAGEIDFEEYHQFGLRVFFEDANGNSGFEVLTVIVENVNELPITFSAPGDAQHPVILVEHSNVGAGAVLLGDVDEFDLDGAPEGYVYTLSGPDAAKFEVVGGQLFLVDGATLDFEGRPQLEVTLTVRDADLAPGTGISKVLTFDVSFAELLGTTGVDVMLGSSGTDVITGLSGDDAIDAGGGGDIIDAGAGNDAIDGIAGNDTVQGGLGNDRLVGGAGNDLMHGDNEVPLQVIEVLSWVAQGAPGTSLAAGFTQSLGLFEATVSFANDGSATDFDVTTATEYVDTAHEEAYAVNSGLVLGGGAGPVSTTSISFAGSNGGPEAEVTTLSFRLNDIDKDAWRDEVTINAFALDGSPVAVVLRADGDDIVTGNTVVAGPAGPVDEFFPPVDEPGDQGGSVLVEIAGPVHRFEIVYRNGLASSQIMTVTDIHFGNGTFLAAGNDVLLGGSGADTLLGDGGNDALRGGTGADSLEGGDGSDSLEYRGSTIAVNVNLGTAVVSGGDAQGDSIAGFERVVGSSFNDTLTGGSGDDLVAGGLGADSLDGGDGLDVLDYRSSTVAVSVNLGGATAFGGEAQGDTFVNFERIYGSVRGDTLTGNTGANLLLGDAGADTLTGAGGNDVLRGGTGADSLNGGSGNDLVDYRESAAAVSVNLGSGAVSGGDAQGDIIANFDRVFGSDHNDTLTGSAAANALFGGAGADTLNGGAGVDVLTGGDGADVFVFGSAAEIGLGLTRDRIADFSPGVDRLDFAAMDLGFIGSGPFTGVAGQLQFSTSSGVGFLSGDTDGNGVADFSLILTGVTAITIADLLL